MAINLFDRPTTFYHWFGKDSPMMSRVTGYRMNGQMIEFDTPLHIRNGDSLVVKVTYEVEGENTVRIDLIQEMLHDD